MVTKICQKCKNEKSGKDFPKGRDRNGLYYICKICCCEQRKQYYRSKDPLTRWVDATFSDVKGRAKKRNIEFSLTKNFVRESFNRQNGQCVYCDRVCDLHGTQSDKRKSPSIDRLLPDNGYITNNVVICCYRCNAIKQDATLEELLKLTSVLASLTKANQNYLS